MRHCPAWLLIAVTAVLAVADEPAPRSRRVLVFVSDSCLPCRKAIEETTAWMRPSGWTFGPTADNHVQVINDQAMAEKFGVTLEPAFVLLVDGKESKRVVGYRLSEPIEVRRRVIVDLFNQ